MPAFVAFETAGNCGGAESQKAGDIWSSLQAQAIKCLHACMHELEVTAEENEVWVHRILDWWGRQRPLTASKMGGAGKEPQRALWLRAANETDGFESMPVSGEAQRRFGRCGQEDAERLQEQQCSAWRRM